MTTAPIPSLQELLEGFEGDRRAFQGVIEMLMTQGRRLEDQSLVIEVTRRELEELQSRGDEILANLRTEHLALGDSMETRLRALEEQNRAFQEELKQEFNRAVNEYKAEQSALRAAVGRHEQQMRLLTDNVEQRVASKLHTVESGVAALKSSLQEAAYHGKAQAQDIEHQLGAARRYATLIAVAASVGGALFSMVVACFLAAKLP